MGTTDTSEYLDLEWYRDVVNNMKSSQYKKTTHFDILILDYVKICNEDVEELTKRIVVRLPIFVGEK